MFGIWHFPNERINAKTINVNWKWIQATNKWLALETSNVLDCNISNWHNKIIRRTKRQWRHYFRESTFSNFRHCSNAVNCIAAYGTILVMVAVFPRHSQTKPFFVYVSAMNLSAALPEYGSRDTWKSQRFVFDNSPSVRPGTKRND